MRVIVFIPRAAERWLKLESLHIDKLQFLIKGNVCLIEKSYKGTQNLLYFDWRISFTIICSSLFFPEARKNLHLLKLKNFSITLINVFAGILFVGPEPPTPNSILISSLFIWNFFTHSKFSSSSIFIWGSSLTSRSNLSLINFLGVSIICCLFFLNNGYWKISEIPENFEIK